MIAFLLYTSRGSTNMARMISTVFNWDRWKKDLASKIIASRA